jgi:hypothetical protein
MSKKFLSVIFIGLIFAATARAQHTAEITISLNEQFFDTFLAAIFSDLDPITFPIGKVREDGEVEYSNAAYTKAGDCSESVKLEREVNGVRTAVRFRDGKITAPLAFSGAYDFPLIGCSNFRGWAEADIELVFDARKQALLGKVKLQNVNLNGTGGVGGSVIARLMQSSIDKKVNPAEILDLGKLDFLLPVAPAKGSLKMKPVGMRHEVLNGVVNVRIGFELSKAQ